MSEGSEMCGQLRQMIAVLQAERQALAGLDLDGIMGAAQDKPGCAARSTSSPRSHQVQTSTTNAAGCLMQRGGSTK